MRQMSLFADRVAPCRTAADMEAAWSAGKTAAFLTIEQIVGRHYELDEFSIQSVTQGKEAMASTLVKLRHDGKLYSGTGISTDIVGAGIRAFVNALNKIVYEEEAK